ncbi:MAG TPA: isoprenoid biosynthesis protein ElbB [Bacteroidales bacterium]|nr:isoprenoid biosynthesis protein ElbB [Bacteroidales bacterium]
MKKKFAIVIAGCGVYDGAEIHEVVMSMQAVLKHGGEYQLFAPDVKQHHVVNHLTGAEMPETRNVLVEAARIARGKIKPLSALNTDEFDALILPGGFGVAKNLSNFAFAGAECIVNAELEQAVLSMVKLKKPIGALCISPAIIAGILPGAMVTIGKDSSDSQAIEKMGAKHMATGHGEVIIDSNYKLATTPCYMLDATILQIAQGADNVVKALLELM